MTSMLVASVFYCSSLCLHGGIPPYTAATAAAVSVTH